MTATKKQAAWDRMAEAVFVDFPRMLQEDNPTPHDLHTVILSESIVVNGNVFIPANSTLTIEEPAE